MRLNADELTSFLTDIVAPRWVKTESPDLKYYGKDWKPIPQEGLEDHY